MKKFIVTTTINPITEAVYKFQKLKDWNLVVVGDKKTPKKYDLTNGFYMTCEMQDSYNKKLSETIGWNCIQRRNFGFLWALENGADIIAIVDDDNIPYEKWGKNLLIGRDIEVNFYETSHLSFDPVGATNYPQLWHRGFPLQLLSKRDYSKKQKKIISPDIQADFWDGDPDIDAICRLEHAPECTFDSSFFPLASNKISPFNSQNTLVTRDVLKNYFLLPQIGRMDDIWASFYVQALGYSVVYGEATVKQERNKHDLIKDMKAEFLGYEYNLDIIQTVNQNPDNLSKYVPKRSWEAFQIYKEHVKSLDR